MPSRARYAPSAGSKTARTGRRRPLLPGQRVALLWPVSGAPANVRRVARGAEQNPAFGSSRPGGLALLPGGVPASLALEDRGAGDDRAAFEEHRRGARTVLDGRYADAIRPRGAPRTDAR